MEYVLPLVTRKMMIPVKSVTHQTVPVNGQRVQVGLISSQHYSNHAFYNTNMIKFNKSCCFSI